MPNPTVAQSQSEMAEVITQQWRNGDGGWLRHLARSDQPHHSDPRITALTLLWLLEYDAKQYEEPIAAGLKFLARTQHLAENVQAKDADGGWGLNNGHKSEVTATAMALLACVKYAKYSNLSQTAGAHDLYLTNMEHARNLLVKQHRNGGGWSDLLSHVSLPFTTCWAALALRECLDLDELYEPALKNPLKEALELVETTQRHSGWGETLSHTHHIPHALATAQCIYLLCKLEEQHRAEDAVIWLKEQQDPKEGSWRVGPLDSPVETTAWALLALRASGQRPTDPSIERGTTYLLSLYLQKQGWPEKPGGGPERETSLYVCLALEACRKATAVAGLAHHPS